MEERRELVSSRNDLMAFRLSTKDRKFYDSFTEASCSIVSGPQKSLISWPFTLRTKVNPKHVIASSKYPVVKQLASTFEGIGPNDAFILDVDSGEEALVQLNLFPRLNLPNVLVSVIVPNNLEMLKVVKAHPTLWFELYTKSSVTGHEKVLVITMILTRSLGDIGFLN